MAIDLYISLSLALNQLTGIPEYPELNIIVPIEYRKWIYQSGNHFQIYINIFNGICVSTEVFLETYPDWDNIKFEIIDWVQSNWTQSDHEEFKTALEWFASKNMFNISWSF